VEAYWTASKSRLDRWGRTLKELAANAPQPPVAGRAASPTLAARGVVEEILTGEVLTRVWAAVLCAYDRQRGQSGFEPLAHSVLLSHMEARHRVLTLLAGHSGIPAEEAIKLDQLRRRCERWIDVLVGHLATHENVAQLAIDPLRAKDFAADMGRQSRGRGGRFAWPLVQASLRTAFSRGLCPYSPNSDLNAKIAEAVIACFPPAAFGATGLLYSAWMLRIARVAGDAQGMLDELIVGRERPAGVPPLRRFGPHWQS
jgi:hypothetical protein